MNRYVYFLVKNSYEGQHIGDEAFSTYEKAESFLARNQEDPDMKYYNDPKDDFCWFIDYLILDPDD